MPWTTQLLVIANRTIESQELCSTLLHRAASGPVQVTLVAPAASGGAAGRARRAATEQRLEAAVQGLREAGIRAEGVLGDADPMLAVHDVWDPCRFDEVIVATLPTGVSRWMAADLPHRVERMTGARVTHIVATDLTGRVAPQAGPGASSQRPGLREPRRASLRRGSYVSGRSLTASESASSSS